MARNALLCPDAGNAETQQPGACNILDMIEAGNPGFAEAAMRAHLTTMTNSLKRILTFSILT